jgi:DNA-binding IclR family transcriptional regulator
VARPNARSIPGDHGLPRLTPNSIARPTHLHEVLAEVRRVGYVIDDQANSPNRRCIAAVIRMLGDRIAVMHGG